MLLELGRNEEALAAYERALQLDGSNVVAWTNRGTALLRLKRPLEALASYEEALTRQPNHVDAWSGKYFALRKLRRFRAAWSALRRYAALTRPGAAKEAING
jgi:tetratricopeptide (TPR) repeat protein